MPGSPREIREQIRTGRWRLREIRELRQLVSTEAERQKLQDEEKKIYRQLDNLLEELRLCPDEDSDRQKSS